MTTMDTTMVTTDDVTTGGYSNASTGDNNGTTWPHNINPRLANGVVVLLLMLFNIGGNSLVFYVYHKPQKNTVFALFVRTLAGLDLLTAMTTMLIDVIMKMRPNDETELDLRVMCKLSHFQVYANSLTCGSVLTLIAYQRYQKICHPLNSSLNLRRAKILLLCIGAFCTLISIPTIIVYGPMDITVLVNDNQVHSVICRYDETYKGTALQLATSYSLLLAFSVVLLTTIILYLMVSRAIQRFERRNSMSSGVPGSPATNPVEIAAANRQWDFSVVVNPVDGQPLTSPVYGRRSIKNVPTPTAPPPPPPTVDECAANKNTKRPNPNSPSRLSIFSMASGNMVSAQMYRMFTLITVVFIISYLPHLVVLILTKALNLDARVLTYGQRMMLEFAYNCPYISTVANPLVYGFSSSEFRDQLHYLLCCTCRRRSSSW